MTPTPCYGCGVESGQLHRDGCRVEPCPACGFQLLSCSCRQSVSWRRLWCARRLPWTGEWPFADVCRQWGWYARLLPGLGWVRCGPDADGAVPDLNRLYHEARWSPMSSRWVRIIPQNWHDN